MHILNALLLNKLVRGVNYLVLEVSLFKKQLQKFCFILLLFQVSTFVDSNYNRKCADIQNICLTAKRTYHECFKVI